MVPALHSPCHQPIRRRLLPAFLFLIGTAGACSTTPESGDDYANINPQDLLVVDCLLPPQVRQLGTQLTYLAQRRAIRTSGANCALRGGEYVAHNRADFNSALSVWLPQAEQGDPQAQTYVGEIYENGLGTRESFEQAASWYQRAANQGFSRAKINLGYLYESGLGVERDLPRALNLYRQASGFTAADIEFVSSIEVATRKSTRLENQGLHAEVELLQAEIMAGRKQLQRQKNQLVKSANNVQTLKDSLAARKSSGANSPKTLTPDQFNNNNTTLKKLETQLNEAVEQKKALHDQLEQRNDKTASLNAQLLATADTLHRVKERLETNNLTIRKLESQLMSRAEDATVSTDALLNAKTQSAKLVRRISSLEKANLQQNTMYSTLLATTTSQSKALNQKISEQNVLIEEIEQLRARELANYHQELTEHDAQFQQTTRNFEQKKDQFEIQRISDEKKLQALKREIIKRETDLTDKATAIQRLQRDLIGKQGNIKSTSIERSIETDGPSINIIDPPVLIRRGSPALKAATQGSINLIGKIEPASTLFAFRINGDDYPVNNSGMFRFDTRSYSGENLELLAINDQGDSTRLELLVTPPDSTKPDTASAQSHGLEESDNTRLPLKGVKLGSYHALIIGNNTYASLSDLKTASNDAIAVEQILREKYGFRTIILLDANQKTMLSALERMRATLGPQDNLVIYYAGHGQLDTQSGRGYWLPTDSGTENRDKWIANNAITAMIDTMSAKHVLVIADSCYSGSLTRSSIARPLSGTNATLRLNWLKAVSQSRVRTVLSSGSNRPVLDGSINSDHSIFAQQLLNILENNNEVLETYALFFELQQQVAEKSAQLDVEQIPQYAPIRHAGHQAGEFVFVPIAQTSVGATTNDKYRSAH